jgi:cellulose synthase/poly-beta-1,6-N-acetylglucosamine synthase-like glycosyltransferase
MDEYLPSVTIGCPISNRQYLIDRYLSGIYNLDYPKQKIKLYFLVNNSKDLTENTLIRFRNKHKNEYNDIIVERYKIEGKKDKRELKVRKEMYKKLAEIRNYVFKKFNKNRF